MSISALMKCTAVIRQFAYGSTADAFDEYLQMSEHTARDALFFFNMCIIKLYMQKYLRKPTSDDVCHGKVNTRVNNDINVLDNSPLFDDLLDYLALVVLYVVNGVEYRNGYYLADGIYLEWASFVKSFTVATDPKHTYFKQRQESARKYVERAFGVLQGCWGLIQQSARAYEVNTLRGIVYVGIILYNMILEDQNMSIVDLNHVYSNPARSMQTMWIDRCETQRRKAKELRDRDTHISLQQNLMNHIWREVKEASKEDYSPGGGFYENKEVSGVIWCYDNGSGVGVGVMLMWR
uniref:Protein ALP1-like n=1 Tax=Tanacetum cinerariifolium TaxID=118510 RepID=A0A699JZD8_TANCI|nr:hypothetical protein [Tanacetum cinerariifolium]